MKGKELLKLSKIIPREKLADLLTEDVIKNYLGRYFVSWRDFGRGAEFFIGAHISKHQTAEKIVEKVKELIFSDSQKNVEEISANFEAIALRLSPGFDIMKILNSFLEDYPLDIMERQTDTDIDTDWDFFRENLAAEKEREDVLKERMLETIFFYAEENEELRSLLKII